MGGMESAVFTALAVFLAAFWKAWRREKKRAERDGSAAAGRR